MLRTWSLDFRRGGRGKIERAIFDAKNLECKGEEYEIGLKQGFRLKFFAFSYSKFPVSFMV